MKEKGAIHRAIRGLERLESIGLSVLGHLVFALAHLRSTRRTLVELTTEPEWRVRVRSIEYGEAPSVVADDDLVAATAHSFLSRGGDA